MKLDEKGQTSFFIVFVVVAIFLLFLFAFGIPFLQNFNTEIYEAADPLIQSAKANAQNISNEEIKQAMLDNLEAQENSIPDQVNVLSVFFQYGWLVVIVAVLFIVFMASRRQIEAGGIS